MKMQVLFGIKSKMDDEKLIMKNINAYLKRIERTTSIAKNASLLRSFLPYTIDHYYWNMNKETGTYFEVFSNSDLNGRKFIKDNGEYAWLIKILFHPDFPGYEREKSEKYVKEIMNSINYDYEILFETDDDESIMCGDV